MAIKTVRRCGSRKLPPKPSISTAPQRVPLGKHQHYVKESHRRRRRRRERRRRPVMASLSLTINTSRSHRCRRHQSTSISIIHIFNKLPQRQQPMIKSISRRRRRRRHRAMPSPSATITTKNPSSRWVFCSSIHKRSSVLAATQPLLWKPSTAQRQPEQKPQVTV